MVDLAKLDELIARVEKATKPDREIDLALWDVFVRKWTGLPYEAGSAEAGPYTESMDAALGLVERMLPGWSVSIYRYTDSLAQAAVGSQEAYGRHEAITPPIAILLALLRALRREASHGH
jgi:hypothetical protein